MNSVEQVGQSMRDTANRVMNCVVQFILQCCALACIRRLGRTEAPPGNSSTISTVLGATLSGQRPPAHGGQDFQAMPNGQ